MIKFTLFKVVLLHIWLILTSILTKNQAMLDIIAIFVNNIEREQDVMWGII